MHKKIKLATDWTGDMSNLEKQKFKSYLKMFWYAKTQIRHPEHWDKIRENIYRYVVFGDVGGITRDAKGWKAPKVLDAIIKENL